MDDPESKKRRVCRAGAGVEFTYGKCDTPGFSLQQKSKIVYVPRDYWRMSLQRNDKRLLQSSVFLAQSTRANGDVSVLLYDKSFLHPSCDDLRKVVGYLVDYAGKSNETEHDTRKKMASIIQESGDSDSLTPDVRRVAIRCMNQISKDKLVSKQEAMCLMGNLDLFICSESVESISISSSKRVERGGSVVENKNLREYIDRGTDCLEMSFHEYTCKQKQSKGRKEIIPHYFGVKLNYQKEVTANYARSILKVYRT